MSAYMSCGCVLVRSFIGCNCFVSPAPIMIFIRIVLDELPYLVINVDVRHENFIKENYIKSTVVKAW